ncbi:MAG: hypothetical protein ACRDU5_17155, partial [Mycobacterium sp.]
VLTLGATLTGLGVAGAGAAQADTGSAGPPPASVSAGAHLDAPLFPPIDFSPDIPYVDDVFHDAVDRFHAFDSPWGSWDS